MIALVTGATGFIGSHLVEVLADNGWEVRALVRSTSNRSDLEGRGVEFFVGDVRDAESLKKAAKGVDAVFHVAALVGEWGNPQDFYDINVTGMKNMLEAATGAGVSRFIDVSSTSVHGYEGFNRDTEQLPYKKTGILYSDTKMEAEKLVWEAHAEGRIQASTVRPCMVWGPRDRVFMVKIIHACRSRMFMYVNGGKNNAGLAHVRNVCDIILRAATRDEAIGKAFIATDSCDTTMRMLVETLCESLKLPKPWMSVPYPLAKTLGNVSESVYRRFNASSAPLLTKMGIAIIGNNLSFDVSRAKTLLGYEPKYLFPQSLPAYLDWFRSEYKWKSGKAE